MKLALSFLMMTAAVTAFAMDTEPDGSDLPLHIREFKRREHIHSARVLMIEPQEWIDRVAEEERRIGHGLFSDRRERLQTFLVAELIRAAFQSNNLFLVGWNTAYYRYFDVIESKGGRETRDFLAKTTAVELGLPMAAAPTWQDYQRVKLERRSAALSFLYPGAGGSKAASLHGVQLIREIPRIHVAIQRLNDLPRSGIVRIALETLLELELHATFVKTPVAGDGPSARSNDSPMALCLTDGGIKIPMTDTRTARRSLDAWLRARHVQYAAKPLPSTLAKRDCENSLGYAVRVVGAKLLRW